MVIFQDIQDVEEWLDPMTYADIWDAVAPYNVFTDEFREHCDGLTTSGAVPTETILKGLKLTVRAEIRDRLGLDHRRYRTVAREGVKSLH